MNQRQRKVADWKTKDQSRVRLLNPLKIVVDPEDQVFKWIESSWNTLVSSVGGGQTTQIKQVKVNLFEEECQSLQCFHQGLRHHCIFATTKNSSINNANRYMEAKNDEQIHIYLLRHSLEVWYSEHLLFPLAKKSLWFHGENLFGSSPKTHWSPRPAYRSWPELALKLPFHIGNFIYLLEAKVIPDLLSRNLACSYINKTSRGSWTWQTLKNCNSRTMSSVKGKGNACNIIAGMTTNSPSA